MRTARSDEPKRLVNNIQYMLDENCLEVLQQK
jgi:hypothetical protein